MAWGCGALYLLAPMRLPSIFLGAGAEFVGAVAPLTGQRRADPTSLPASRSTDGRLEIRATPSTGPIRVDGVLDDSAWVSASPWSGFVQSEPDEGRPASEPTEV